MVEEKCEDVLLVNELTEFFSSGLAPAVVTKLTAGLMDMLDTTQYVQLSRKPQKTSFYCILP